MTKDNKTLWVLKTLFTAGWAPIMVVVVYSIVDQCVNGETIVYPWLDNVAHFSGGVAIAYFFYKALKNFQEVSGSSPAIFIYVSTVGLTAVTAIAWEFLEYLSDTYRGTHIILGVTDTISDLTLGVLGGAALIVLVTLRSMFGPSKFS